MQTTGRLHDHAGVVPLVLGLACRHSQLGANLQAVCALLRVSKAVQQAVVDACSGPGNSQLQLCMSNELYCAKGRGRPAMQCLQHLTKQAKWLATYSKLVKELIIERPSVDLMNVDEGVIWLALRPSVQLQALTLPFVNPLLQPAAVLQQLDAAHLTRLSVGVADRSAAAPLPAALRRLTALQQLTVNSYSDTSFATARVRKGFAGALQALSNLTELSLGLCAIPADLVQLLPSGLVKLQLQTPVLAPCPAVQHLTRLQQLQQLEVKHADTCDAAVLASLSTLGSLQRLSLAYSNLGRAVALDSMTQHGSAWAVLPALKQLHIECVALTPAVSSAVSAATSVTYLQLRCSSEPTADPAAALVPLTQLQRLCVVAQWPRLGGDSDMMLSSFSAAVSKSISHLVWCGVRLSPLARQQLKAAAQLQLLIVDSCSIDDEDLQVLGQYLNKLQTLGVVVGQHISQEGVAAAMSGGRFPALQQLVAAVEESTPTAGSCGRKARQQQLVDEVAVVRPGVEVVHLESLGWGNLSWRSYV